MELLEKHEKWRSWLVGCCAEFLREWEKMRGEGAKEKLQKLSDFQKQLEDAFRDIIGQCKSLIKEYSSCGVDWFYKDVLQNGKASQFVKDCADIVYYELPVDEKYKDTIIFKSAKLIYEKFGLVEGTIYPEPPEPLPEKAEQRQIDEWNESMADACSGIDWEEELERDWLVVYMLIFAFYAALKNEEVLFLVKAGEEVELNGWKLAETDTPKAAPMPAGKKKDKEWKKVFTSRAQEYFGKAIKEGWMAETEHGYEWTFACEAPELALAYFCYRVYNMKRPPYKKLGYLFGKITDPNSKLNPISKNAYKLLKETPWYEDYTSIKDNALSKEEKNKIWNKLPQWFKILLQFFHLTKKEDAQ